MEYAEIILKLTNDIAKLESHVAKLTRRVYEVESNVDELMDKKDVSENVDKEKAFLSKNEVIGLLKSKGLKEEIEIEKASRREGNGVIVKYKNKTKKVMLKSSRDYSKKEGNNDVDFIGWHALPLEVLENYDGYIFTVAYKDDIELFIFNPEELKAFVSDKHLAKSSDSYSYHFNFAQEKNGDYVDCREPDNIKSTSQYRNNWEALK